MRKFLLTSFLLAVLSVGPLAADAFKVTLISGNTFVTRYQPHQSETEEDKVLMMTEFGNWISLPKEAVVSITSDTESRGFGTVLDSQTIILGSIPPSLAGATQSDDAPLDPTAQLLQQMLQQQNAPAPPQPIYTNQLIVEPSQSTGIPFGAIRR